MVGASTEVEVTASNSNVTINTVDASIGNIFDVQQLNNLPVQQRNDPTALFHNAAGRNGSGSVTGARVDQNNITLDGLDVNDFATGGASQNNSGVSSSDSTSLAMRRWTRCRSFAASLAAFRPRADPAAAASLRWSRKQRHQPVPRQYQRVPSRPFAGSEQLVQQQRESCHSPQPPDPESIWRQHRRPYSEEQAVLLLRLQRLAHYQFGAYVHERFRWTRCAPATLATSTARGGTSSLTPAQVKALDPAGIGESPSFLVRGQCALSALERGWRRRHQLGRLQLQRSQQ